MRSRPLTSFWNILQDFVWRRSIWPVLIDNVSISVQNVCGQMKVKGMTCSICSRRFDIPAGTSSITLPDEKWAQSHDRKSKRCQIIGTGECELTSSTWPRPILFHWSIRKYSCLKIRAVGVVKMCWPSIGVIRQMSYPDKIRRKGLDIQMERGCESFLCLKSELIQTVIVPVVQCHCISTSFSHACRRRLQKKAARVS